MAGLIMIGENESWSVATWVFSHVLRQTIPFIPPGNKRLVLELEQEMLDDRLHYVDLSHTTIAEKQMFLDALKRGLEQTTRDGADAFADPEFYPGFVDRFRELVDLCSRQLNMAHESDAH